MAIDSDTKSKRAQFVRLTYMCFAIPAMLILMTAVCAIYINLAGMSWSETINNRPLWMRLGFFASFLVPIPFGLALGGLIWSRVARRLFAVNREEMENLLLGGNIRIEWLDRANRNSIDKCYSEENEGGA